MSIHYSCLRRKAHPCRANVVILIMEMILIFFWGLILGKPTRDIEGTDTKAPTFQIN